MSAEEKDRYQKRENKKFEKSLICKKEKKKTHRENSDKQKNRKDSTFSIYESRSNYPDCIDRKRAIRSATRFIIKRY